VKYIITNKGIYKFDSIVCGKDSLKITYNNYEEDVDVVIDPKLVLKYIKSRLWQGYDIIDISIFQNNNLPKSIIKKALKEYLKEIDELVICP